MKKNSSLGSSTGATSTGRPTNSSRVQLAIICIVVLVAGWSTINNQKIFRTTMTGLMYTEQQQHHEGEILQHSSPYDEASLALPLDDTTTAILITSAWISAHPSTFLLDTVINSTQQHLIGLSPTTPIIITVDHLRLDEEQHVNNATLVSSKLMQLDQYVSYLTTRYASNPHVHILASVRHVHIGGSVKKGVEFIDRVYPNTKYIYQLQHDFPFSADMDHVALTQVIDRHEEVNWIRFPKRDPMSLHPACGHEVPIWFNSTLLTSHKGDPDIASSSSMNTSDATAINDATSSDGGGTKQQHHDVTETKQLQLYPTDYYSDNNHLARFTWYKHAILELMSDDYNRPPEWLLQDLAGQACAKNETLGLYLYPEVTLDHMDGRTGVEINGTWYAVYHNDR